ncbi:MAG: hypothetical protein DI565_15430 [Ancylobacter novellus]|uniref:DUF2059 domain-containing protein n=1 Tax=Ancylobacter novellus TaxID=921 RepID=A0A2W5M6P9_ANCNO|nr:MAG: hypothetical protein DI565_15430 [Ancylobacter novellus]
MKIRIVAAAGLVALAVLLKPDAGRAQTPDPEALRVAQELIALTVTDGLREAFIDSSWPQMEHTLRANPMRLSGEEIAALKSDFSTLLRSEIEKTMSDTPDIYAKYFSAAELQDMIDFYKTETGRKSLTVLPAMTAELMQRTNERAPAMMQRIMIAFAEVLKKRGVNTP